MSKILIVDDNRSNREFLVSLLGYKGHHVVEAADGHQAMVVVEEHLPDLVISDILMPVADGYEFVRQLRAHPRAGATPVIFYTAAYHAKESQNLATASGAVKFLNKPSDPEVILLAVDSALKQISVPAQPLDAEFDREHLRLLTDKLARKVAELEKEIEERKLAEVERDALAGERAARIEAERAGKIKDEFLATLSHELRTPLNAILGWAQILRLDPTDPDDLKQGLETIERNAHAQTKIIEDLLDMSRIISGKVRLDVQRVDIGVVIMESIEAVRPAAEAKGIRMLKVLDPLAGPVSGDASRLQQVLYNLLNNSVKFTDRGGQVQVILERVNSHLEISVHDSGAGIAPEFLPHVFERFRQADGSTTRRHGGLGIGLSIVKQLIELHGGSVRAKSPGPGRGSTFVICLPVASVAASDPTERRHHPVVVSNSPLPSEPPKLTGIKILVVDDAADARALVKHVLTQCQAEVFVASSVDEAVATLKDHKPNIVVCDIGMPDRDGYDFIKELRGLSDESIRNTPAIAMTAFARSEDRRRALLAGFQMHVAKPVEPLELVIVISSIVGKTERPA